ncbi:MAG: hypothetical protein NTY84_13580, partial [Verrucomicrobia bacterium]|nr:hypothetical protein [Verrucomicrobiota bacterium]
ERSSRATKGASPTASRGFLFRAMSESPKSQTTKQEILPIYMVIWYEKPNGDGTDNGGKAENETYFAEKF